MCTHLCCHSGLLVGNVWTELPGQLNGVVLLQFTVFRFACPNLLEPPVERRGGGGEEEGRGGGREGGGVRGGKGTNCYD